ncbi:hypothetical protein P691DRAFT_508815 [Macrolepiota fuliginosa MF-IS2]|uniref:Uncharacterized protein n=1 Tax=Macrolepiota fuliginosa MF-IS2 TaxID=1400762 RepID=A0A9P5X3C0_9AGAR|nr:hypothetical protein P691DRAFT_508815 [Macrolepiota fuliginosa MF-IS2]
MQIPTQICVDNAILWTHWLQGPPIDVGNICKYSIPLIVLQRIQIHMGVRRRYQFRAEIL